MDQKIIDFLTKERMAALSICLSDGTPHTSAMHFVYNNGTIYFSTHNTSKKATGLTTSKASVTVGFSEQNWVTVQLDGTAEITTDGKDLILGKYPESIKFMDANTIFLKFTPVWWRYSDFKSTPPIFLASE